MSIKIDVQSFMEVNVEKTPFLSIQEDAERLFKSSQRYDLLNEYYQATGQWGKALETSEMYDRVHLRTTYYNYAKHLENKGDINGAIPK